MDYFESDLSHEFLVPLKDIPSVPTKLWQIGILPSRGRRQKVVAIVGSRRCTSYGENIAYKTAYELARAGVIVVSGMAYGIDSHAHRGSLDAGGKTVAV